MRLIDADALPRCVLWTWGSGLEVEAVTVKDIDVAPTVRCGRCTYNQYRRKPIRSGGDIPLACVECGCGSRFTEATDRRDGGAG